MSPPPLRLRLGPRDVLLVPARDVIEIHDRDAATQVVEQADVDAAQAEALVQTLLADPVVVVDPRPTWISLEVTHAAGEGHVAWELGKTRALELPAAAHHRTHVTLPRAFRFSV